jgi:aminopeptidase N
LNNIDTDNSVKALLLLLPTLEEMITTLKLAEPDKIYAVMHNITVQISTHFKDILHKTYQQLISNRPYTYTTDEVGKRTLKNVVLKYLLQTGEQQFYDLAERQYAMADNMTDLIAVLYGVTHLDISLKEKLLDDFYKKWQHEPLVVNKWLQVQAISDSSGTLTKVRNLLSHASFRINNPNNVYSLIGGFCNANLLNFHARNGSGYKFLTEQIIILDAMNPQVAARMIVPFTKLANYDLVRQAMIKENLQEIASHTQLSKNMAEIVNKSLD